MRALCQMTVTDATTDSPNARKQPEPNQELEGTLRVEWLRGWDDRLDGVLDALPEPPGCPHSLLRLLLRNEVPARKRVAVVLDGSDPVALIPLRDADDPWQVATNWITPDPFPALPGLHIPALAAARHDISVSWWQCDDDVPAHPRIRGCRSCRPDVPT